MCVDCVFLGLKPKKEVGLPFLFYLLKENIESILRKSTASANTENVRRGELALHSIKFPPQYLVDQFNNFCNPFFELQRQNEQVIRKLSRLQKCWIESLE